eukprot:CAMPEP_0181181900 /NCGR_PEP_ID=MMETSP1096-20121128/7590_1 /TAXON_ID=156174 ORGANISM="Chrysochromulina ericina, Strain CCMP281" /NCGR_SAMPLE_ID=MMETSP1096 /ASSEMBLY_ACC=CAM_ASM_000453 /LENGTH=71 /DNA_ID=CAMNT_0023270447 /DNA_START=220 /DNA_END=436 /DNA_ORIENTATION=-
MVNTTAGRPRGHVDLDDQALRYDLYHTAKAVDAHGCELRLKDDPRRMDKMLVVNSYPKDVEHIVEQWWDHA